MFFLERKLNRSFDTYYWFHFIVLLVVFVIMEKNPGKISEVEIVQFLNGGLGSR